MAAARLVNGSTQADHLRAPGVRSPESCSCVLLPAPFTGDHKGKKAVRTHETEQKMESNKTRNFQGDLFIKRLLGLLYLEEAVLHGVFSISR